jgi:hypothetical protein
MNSQIRLDGLLMTKDQQVTSVMNQILGTFSIETQICGDLDSALEAVSHRRLDTIIVDWDGISDPTRLVRAVRKSSPNCNSTVVAMVNAGSETHALLVGANFMILKPADLDHANRCMRAAYGTMLQNRRRSARVSVDLPVRARVIDGDVIEARISDISVGGIALQCKQPLQLHQEVFAQFSLPGLPDAIQVVGKIVNANVSGRAGVHFTYVSESDLMLLESWLAIELAKLEKAEMPGYDGSAYHN